MDVDIERDETIETAGEDAVPAALAAPVVVPPEDEFHPFPDEEYAFGSNDRPVWRVRLDVLGSNGRIKASLFLDLNGEVIFGRGDSRNMLNLSQFDRRKEISRRHAILYPSETHLLVADMGSSNGTLLNGHAIGHNIPFSLSNGDVLTLGNLQVAVTIAGRHSRTLPSREGQSNLVDIFTEGTRAIVSYLELDLVLKETLSLAQRVTDASETALWLVDPQTNELFLEADLDAQAGTVQQVRMAVRDNSVAEVIRSGEMMSINRGEDGRERPAGASIVKALVYVPIALGGVVVGALAAAYHEAGREFGAREQRLLENLAGFAAIGIHNARLYKALGHTHTRSQGELGATNRLAQVVNRTGDPRKVFALLASEAAQHSYIKRVSFWIVNEETTSVRPLFDSQTSEGGGLWERVVEAMVRTALAENRPVWSVEINLESLGLSIEGEQADARLALPVSGQGQTHGALVVQRGPETPFTLPELPTLQTYAGLLAMSIANTQLAQQKQSRPAPVQRATPDSEVEIQSANENLQALARLKDEFVANVSHQLRTPITNLKLLQDVLRDTPNRKRGQYMESMRRETLRLERIVDDMLRLARLDQGEVALQATKVNLNALVQNYVTDRRSLAEHRGIELSVILEPDLPDILVDAELMTQVLSNLLVNALTYTPEGGGVAVQTVAREIDGQNFIGFVVRDTGPGISEEEQPYLFERFFRGEVGRESRTSGTGLGLAIAHEIVRLHFGRLEVYSEGIPGKGTAFSVLLPLAGLNKANLLVIDDDATLLGVMQEILVSYGYEVTAASSAEQALKVLESVESEKDLPHVIITDVIMTRMTGIQLVEAVREDKAWAHIPFLFISASTTLAMEGQIAGLEGVTFLRKPFDSETLQEAVTSILSAGRLGL